MSFLFGVSPFEELVDKATSENILIGNTDYATALDIAEQIKAKTTTTPQQAIKIFKKKLALNKNPNVSLHTLVLLDICVKNSGNPFQIQIASTDFMDTLVDIVNGGTNTSNAVRQKILSLIQSWGLAFKNRPELGNVYQVYEQLKREGRMFPPVIENEIHTAMIDTIVAPEWKDSATCTRCRDAFTTFNRKHHCRNCGETFCQECSSKNIPLPHLGLHDDVRVCDGCYSKVTNGKIERHDLPSIGANGSNATIPKVEDEDDELQKAIEASLRDNVKSNQSAIQKPKQTVKFKDEEEDADLMAAIQASLQETSISSKSKERVPYSYQPKEHHIEQRPSVGKYVAPVVIEQKKHNANELSSVEVENINLFYELVEKLEHEFSRTGNGAAIVGNTQIQALNMQMISLQPKLIHSLNETSEKYHTFVNLNEKMVQAIKIYDQMLHDRLSNITQLSPSLHAYQSSLAGSYQQPAIYPPQQHYSPPVEHHHDTSPVDHQYYPQAPPAHQQYSAPPISQPQYSAPPNNHQPQLYQSQPPITTQHYSAAPPNQPPNQYPPQTYADVYPQYQHQQLPPPQEQQKPKEEANLIEL